MDEEVVVKKQKVRRSGYAAFEEAGEGIFRLVGQAASLKGLKDRIIAEKLSGEFWLVCVRQKVKTQMIEQLKLKAV